MAKRDASYLYIREWMDVKGLTDEAVAETLDVGRNTVWRWRHEQWRLNPQKIATLAAAIGIKPADLYRSPRRASIDAVLAEASDDVHEATLELARRLARPDPEDQPDAPKP